MGKSSEEFIKQREGDTRPLAPTPIDFIWKEYFTMLGDQYNYEYKQTEK
tara:strand:- start:762 stop:908 length:147 start_codon:yes stop_codon:yes gene_type:complete